MLSGIVSTHSRPKAAAFCWHPVIKTKTRFQHTAARRRLPKKILNTAHRFCGFNTQPPEGGCQPKLIRFLLMYCFNTQPPEGGCAKCQEGKVRENLFQHTAARRRLHDVALSNCWLHCFNTQPPEGGCSTWI